MKVKVKARLSFPALFEAEQYQGTGDFNYSAQFLVEEGSEADKSVREAIKQVATEKWKEKATGVLKGLHNNKQLCCYYEGDIVGRDGYEGMMVLTAKRKEGDGRPDIRDRDASPLTEKDGKPYAGCYVNAVVELWAQDNNYGKRVNASLSGVQFFRDGDAFAGGGAASEDEFDDIAEGATAGDLV